MNKMYERFLILPALSVLSLCTVFLPVLGQGEASDQEYQTAFATGVELLKRGRPAEAERIFFELLEKHPDDPILRHNLGITLRENERHSDAVHQFEAALQLAPDMSSSRTLLALSLLSLGKEADAIKELERVTREVPDNLIVRFQLARIYEREGRILDAVTQFQEIARRDPDDPEAAYQLGRAYLEASKWSYQRLFLSAPESARAYQARGQIRLIEGNLQSAADNFERAVRQDPTLPDLNLSLAFVYQRMGDLDKALEAVEAELRIAPGNQGARQLQQTILQEKKITGSE